MAFNPNQPRASNGEFAAANAGEQSARGEQRYPVAPHAGVKSVGSHGGHQVLTRNERTGAMEVTHGGRRRTTAEWIARGIRTDGGFSRVR